MNIDTRYLDKNWKKRFRKYEKKLSTCYETVFTSILKPEILDYEPKIYIVNFFFRFETERQGTMRHHTNWNLNGPDPFNSSREAIVLPVQTIKRLSKNDLKATIAHELHEILGKTVQGRLESDVSLEEARETVHKRSFYDLFSDPIRGLLIEWDALEDKVKAIKVRLSITPTKTFRSSKEFSNWLISH